MSGVAALILAGARGSPEMQAATGGLENRALVPLAGRSMLDYVVEAVRGGLKGSGRVLVAGDVPTPPGCDAVPGGASLVDTLLNGAAALAPEESRLLVATADIPFLTSEAVADFLRQAERLPAQFHYPIVPADRCAERFPRMRRTTLRIAEGRFTGGNLVLLDPSFLRSHEGCAARRLRPAQERGGPRQSAGAGAALAPGRLAAPARPAHHRAPGGRRRAGAGRRPRARYRLPFCRGRRGCRPPPRRRNRAFFVGKAGFTTALRTVKVDARARRAYNRQRTGKILVTVRRLSP